MNEVSIIINGVRYDSTKTNSYNPCDFCDLRKICDDAHNALVDLCDQWVGSDYYFKKSDKKFER